MSRFIAVVVVLAVSFGVRSSLGWSQDAGKPNPISELVQLGPGVHKVKADPKGRIQTCVLVGQSRISTVLGASKGLQDAREKARIACEAEFVRWVKTHVRMYSKSESETILFLEGQEGADNETLRESGKAVERNSQRFETLATGLVRGLQILGADVDSKDKTYTVVMGWSAQAAAATKRVQSVNKDGTVKDGTDPGSKKIEDKQVISPDLKRFLD